MILLPGDAASWAFRILPLVMTAFLQEWRNNKVLQKVDYTRVNRVSLAKAGHSVDPKMEGIPGKSMQNAIHSVETRLQSRKHSPMYWTLPECHLAACSPGRDWKANFVIFLDLQFEYEIWAENWSGKQNTYRATWKWGWNKDCRSLDIAVSKAFLFKPPASAKLMTSSSLNSPAVSSCHEKPSLKHQIRCRHPPFWLAVEKRTKQVWGYSNHLINMQIPYKLSQANYKQATRITKLYLNLDLQWGLSESLESWLSLQEADL